MAHLRLANSNLGLTNTINQAYKMDLNSKIEMVGFKKIEFKAIENETDIKAFRSFVRKAEYLRDMGVYLITGNNNNGTYRAIYVGYGSTLSNRLLGQNILERSVYNSDYSSIHVYYKMSKYAWGLEPIMIGFFCPDSNIVHKYRSPDQYQIEWAQLDHNTNHTNLYQK